MIDEDIFAKSNEIFSDLFNLANQALGSKGLNIAPSVIVERIISPLKDLYLKNLAEVLESHIKEKY